MKTEYVDNDVWRFRITLKESDIDRTIYTKEFPWFYELTENERVKYKDSYDYAKHNEQIVHNKYFTKERIEEIKQLFIKKIQESENPFYINCVDWDGGYNVTKEELFNLD